jgi:Holliday junction resolvase - archaeal type
MGASKRGLNYEHRIANGIYLRTEIPALRSGYSGNQLVPSPDIVIDDGEKLHAIELKTTSEGRTSLTWEADDEENDDISGLLEFTRDCPRTVCPYLGVKFNHRQLSLAKGWPMADDTAVLLETFAGTAPTDVRLTNNLNLSWHKPDTDEWLSQQKGDDIKYICEVLGLDQSGE